MLFFLQNLLLIFRDYLFVFCKKTTQYCCSTNRKLNQRKISIERQKLEQQVAMSVTALNQQLCGFASKFWANTFNEPSCQALGINFKLKTFSGI